MIFALKPAKPVGNCSNDGDDNERNDYHLTVQRDGLPSCIMLGLYV